MPFLPFPDPFFPLGVSPLNEGPGVVGIEGMAGLANRVGPQVAYGWLLYGYEVVWYPLLPQVFLPLPLGCRNWLLLFCGRRVSVRGCFLAGCERMSFIVVVSASSSLVALLKVAPDRIFMASCHVKVSQESLTWSKRCWC